MVAECVIVQDLVHAGTFIACGALLWALDILRKISSDGPSLLFYTDACTPYIISMPIIHPVRLTVLWRLFEFQPVKGNRELGESGLCI